MLTMVVTSKVVKARAIPTLCRQRKNPQCRRDTAELAIPAKGRANMIQDRAAGIPPHEPK
jgi:hypothetical protein